MSTRGDFDIKADVADCGNPRDGKTNARVTAINTNNSLRMVLSFSQAVESPISTSILEISVFIVEIELNPVSSCLRRVTSFSGKKLSPCWHRRFGQRNVPSLVHATNPDREAASVAATEGIAVLEPKNDTCRRLGGVRGRAGIQASQFEVWARVYQTAVFGAKTELFG